VHFLTKSQNLNKIGLKSAQNIIKQERPANAKENAHQWCMSKGPL